ncbi:hypothetical protein Barb6XT_02634 [Bacteroidales bacterium Barb6XT]|nr:hypothetical protein Barb6XT_02634 [Bacteroidales bacterium Barb6XT]
MTTANSIKLFEDKKVRSVWDGEQEKWYISIVDVIGVLTESVDATAYWRKLKQRLREEGNETVTNCHGLKMLAHDGKMRMTDVKDDTVKGILKGYRNSAPHSAALHVELKSLAPSGHLHNVNYSISSY